MIKKYLLFLILLFQFNFFFGLKSFSLSPTFSRDYKIKNFDIVQINRFANRKDPFLAGLISTIMPGVGQIYADEYTKGSLIVLGDFLGKGAIVALVISFTNKYASTADDSVSWEELSGGDKTLLLSSSIIYLSFYIWNIVDAVESTHEYNAKYFREPSLNLTLDTSGNQLKIAVQTVF